LKAGAALEERDVIDWMKFSLASYKVPKRVLFRSALQKSGYGKLVKAQIRDIVLRELKVG
jgi:acyl-CoA synthetase (AMP-forming)/AMP-acid ligase II